MTSYFAAVLFGLVLFFLIKASKNNLSHYLLQRILLLTPSGKAKQYNKVQSLLEKHSAYFNNLSQEAKDRFIRRCLDFVDSKEFIGMEGIKITEEMKLKLASSAIQITFGFKNFYFSHYHTFKIFPEPFYSRMFDRYLKGGTSLGGIMYFSWKDFIHGYAHDDDRYNLGLHEMAHALRLQLLHGSDFDTQFANYADEWEAIAEPEFEAMKNRESSFLRSYASVNIEEFFAVCIEHFFEVPDEFHAHLPDLYNHLCFLLNQDPRQKLKDYKLAPDFKEKINSVQGLKPIPLKLKWNYKYSSYHWSFGLIFAGIFIATPIIITLHEQILFTIYDLILVLVGASAISTGFYKFFYERGIYSFRHLIFFSMFGAGLISFALILLLNINFVYDNHSKTYKIIGYDYYYDSELKGNRYHLHLKNDDLKNYKQAVEFVDKNSDELVPQADSVQIKFSTGLVGFRNIESKTLIPKKDLQPRE